MTKIAKVAGITINLSGVDYIVPPLALGALEQLRDRIGNFDPEAVTGVEQVSTVIDCAHAALRRNYPEMTRDEVADLIDLGNMMAVFEAIMDVSGLKRKGQEAAAEGKPEAAES